MFYGFLYSRQWRAQPNLDIITVVNTDTGAYIHYKVVVLKEVVESLTLDPNHVIIASYPKSSHS